MVDLKPFNKLMMTSTATQLATLPLPYANARGDQIPISGLDTSHRNISITPR